MNPTLACRRAWCGEDTDVGQVGLFCVVRDLPRPRRLGGERPMWGVPRGMSTVGGGGGIG